jgi:amino acid adenylation domain-containing protein/FkbM family methyltransferase
MARVAQDSNGLLVDRCIYQYSEEELEKIAEALKNETQIRAKKLTPKDVAVDQALPTLVRGPLTIGDMICWQAAIGPSYRPGSLGYVDSLKAPHTMVKNPLTGWQVKYSQQHEDFMLASQRGMPAPFDNGVMRFAWITPLLTNWLGNSGILKRLSIQIVAPNLYGDTTWYHGEITEKSESDESTLALVKITGVNQLGITTATGEAEVLLFFRQESHQRRSHELQLETRNGPQESSNGPFTHALFELQAEQKPNEIALVFNDQKLTYDELNGRANQLAHFLQALGVGPEVYVGIYLERSIDTVIGLLAVLKTGGAYVPLDPEYPEERLAFIVKDVGISIILSHQRMSKIIPEHGHRLVRLDSDWNTHIDNRPEENPVSIIVPDNPAYVIYTSGSTKQPNGVIVTHSSLGLYLNSIKSALGVTANDVYLHTASFSFSAAVRQTMLPLVLGSTLVIANLKQRRDPLFLSELIKKHNVTIWDTVPAFLRYYIEFLYRLEHNKKEKLLSNSLQRIFVTGEALTWDIPQMWASRLKHNARIINLYSQTETTGTVSYYRVPKEFCDKTGTVPLGSPVENTRIYILDKNRQPVPKDTEGEIYVGGYRLAKEYLNKPELTAESFIRDTFSDDPSARLFRTGDIGRYLSDGNIEFLGRVDHRVNIRGFRIAPLEIEAALKQHPGIKEAVIASREDIPGEKRLIAYIVPDRSNSPMINGHKRYKLPNNMAIAHLNKHETDFTYSAIFEQQTYLKHGINFNDGDCIFDVGANIGLFSLFANHMCKNPKIYAFEPNPAVFKLLEANVSLYGSEISLFQLGLAEASKTATFTFFQGSSIQSGFYVDAASEKAIAKAVIMNQQKKEAVDMAEFVKETDYMLNQRFSPLTITAKLTTLSNVIEQEDIDCIHLLKINVEKSELDVLMGIKDNNWKKIEQIIVKVDLKETLDLILSVLIEKGYEVVADKDALLENTQIHTVYAIRPSNKRMLIKEQEQGAHIRSLPALDNPLISIGEMKGFLGKTLPNYMIPSTFVFLEKLPLTVSGKVDRRALPIPPHERPELEEIFLAPRNNIEIRIAKIWESVLGCKTIGVNDNFFELGGDSLSATRIISQIRDAFHVEVSLEKFFEQPTVRGLGELIDTVIWLSKDSQHLHNAALDRIE